MSQSRSFIQSKSFETSFMVQTDSLPSIAEGEQTSEKGFMWKSQWQHAMYFVAYTFSWSSFASYRKGGGVEDMSDVPNWFHYILVYIFFAAPLLYLQIFIGQFTQRGCLVVGAMFPLAYGVGYSMLINTLLNCSVNIYFCSSVLHYTMVAMINYPTPSWMLCLPQFTFRGNCFSRDDIDLCPSTGPKSKTPCFDTENDVLSASIFKDEIIFKKSTEENESFDAVPQITQAVHLCLTGLLIMIFSVRSLKDLDGSVRIWNSFAVISIVITCMAIILNRPRFTFLRTMFRMEIRSLVNLKCWESAVLSTAQRLNVMEGGHFLFGSYMQLTVNCAKRVAYLMAVHLVVLLLCNIQGYMMEEHLASSLNLDVTALYKYSDIEFTFVMYPTALGILAAAQLWSTLYFLILFSLTMHSIVIQIILIEQTLSQQIINPMYYNYVRVLLVLLTLVFAILFTSKSGSSLAFEVFFRRALVIFVLLCFIYIVLFLYGIQRIGDDIHFLQHSPNSRYIRWSWIVGSGICFVVAIRRLTYLENLRYPQVSVVFLVLTFLPTPLGLLYKVFIALKRRNFAMLVRQDDSWGPQDPYQKEIRKLFNPRNEVRFRRRIQTCKHRCLLNSTVLRKSIEKELTLLTNVMLEIEENEEESELKTNTIQVLQKHRSIMSEALHGRWKKERDKLE